MSILNSIMGNASEVEVEEMEKEFSQILTEDEKLVRVFKLVRDLFAFTDRRLILVDKQGISGKKTEYHSIPYKSITHFSFETAGRIDLDTEMKVWISGNELPIKKEFKKGIDVTDVQRTLAKFTLD